MSWAYFAYGEDVSENFTEDIAASFPAPWKNPGGSWTSVGSCCEKYDIIFGAVAMIVT